MKLSDIMLTEISQSQKDKYRMIPFKLGTQNKFIETDNGMVVARV